MIVKDTVIQPSLRTLFTAGRSIAIGSTRFTVAETVTLLNHQGSYPRHPIVIGIPGTSRASDRYPAFELGKVRSFP